MSTRMEAPHVAEYGLMATGLTGRNSSTVSPTARRELASRSSDGEDRPRTNWICQLYRHIPDAVFFMTDDDRIAASNGPAIALFGYGEDELLGCRIDRVWSPTPGVQLHGRWADQGRMRAGLATTKNGIRFPAALTIIREQGETENFTAAIVEDFRTECDTLRQVRELQGELARLAAAVQAMKAGAADFLEKPLTEQALVAAIDAAMGQGLTGKAFADPEGAAVRVRQLTDREHQVLTGVLDGFQNKAIACQLGISVRTVEVHRANLMAKMGVRNLAELMRLAIPMESGR